MPGRAVGAVDHQLLPHRDPVLVGSGQLVRAREQLSAALAQANPLEGEDGVAEQPAELREHVRDAFGRPDADDHHRHIGIACEEPCARATAPARPVDAQQDGRAGDSSAIQEVAYRDESGPAVDALLASDVDRELGLFSELVREHHASRGVERAARRGRAELARHEPRALERDQSAPLDLHHGLEHRLDPGSRVDRDRDHGQVLGQRQQAIGMKVVKAPESLGPAQQHAGLDAMRTVDVKQRVGEESAPGPVTFAEVGGQLEAVVVHTCAPIVRPSSAAARPTARLTTTLAIAGRNRASSRMRCVSSIQVENVV